MKVTDSSRSTLQSTFPSGKISRCRIAIVDDHAAILEMMVPIIESLPGFKVIGQFTTPEEAVEFCQREQPDVIIADWVLPRVSGPVLLRDLKRVCPRAQLMVFSGNLWPAAIRSALTAGALGIVDKMAVLEVFRRAVQTVAAKRAYFSPLVSEQIKHMVSRRMPEKTKTVALSRRERTVLRYLAEGFSSKEIADVLGISVYTVINHRTNLMRKIGLRRAAQLSLYAAQLGLIGAGVAPVRDPEREAESV